MVNHWLIQTAVGCALGCLSGLGVGGGSLLMLWLTLIAGTDQNQARLMNLMFFIPCALIATVFRQRQQPLNKAPALRAAAGGILGALAGNFLRGCFDPEWLRRLLGILFLLCGIRELFYRERKAR